MLKIAYLKEKKQGFILVTHPSTFEKCCISFLCFVFPVFIFKRLVISPHRVHLLIKSLWSPLRQDPVAESPHCLPLPARIGPLGSAASVRVIFCPIPAVHKKHRLRSHTMISSFFSSSHAAAHRRAGHRSAGRKPEYISAGAAEDEACNSRREPQRCASASRAPGGAAHRPFEAESGSWAGLSFDLDLKTTGAPPEAIPKALI